MHREKYSKLQLWSLFFLLVSLGMLTACSPTEAETKTRPGVNTWLLVTAPEKPLPVNRPVDVKSRTEDAEHRVSHVELYAVEWPSRSREADSDEILLLRSDAAPFDQTTFTASQLFVPTETGHYVIKVVGYNQQGQWDESDYLGFDVQ